MYHVCHSQLELEMNGQDLVIRPRLTTVRCKVSGRKRQVERLTESVKLGAKKATRAISVGRL